MITMASSSRSLVLACSALGRLSSTGFSSRLQPLSKNVKASTIAAVTDRIKAPFVKEPAHPAKSGWDGDLKSPAFLKTTSPPDTSNKSTEANEQATLISQTATLTNPPLTDAEKLTSLIADFEAYKDTLTASRADLGAKEAELDASNAALDEMKKEFEHYIVEADEKVSKLEGEKTVLGDQLEVLKAEMKSIAKIAVQGLGDGL